MRGIIVGLRLRFAQDSALRFAQDSAFLGSRLVGAGVEKRPALANRAGRQLIEMVGRSLAADSAAR